MNQQSVTVRVPATSANLGPGFDAVGLAVTLFANVTITLDAAPPGRQPPDPMRRMVASAARATYKHAALRIPRGLGIDVDSNIPLGRGFGASAAARAAGIVGANALIGDLLSEQEILNLGTKLEGHPDNIAPALFGGLQVVALGRQRRRGAHRRPAQTRPALRRLHARFLHAHPRNAQPPPQTPQHHRRRLQQQSRRPPHRRAGHRSLGRPQHRHRRQRLHQRPRSKLFPRMYDLFDVARDAGAHGAYLSGGGSTILAFSDNAHAEPIRDAIVQAADRFDIVGTPFILDPCAQGATIVPSPA